jgi:thiamine-phosphate pyrophosphorylase
VSELYPIVDLDALERAGFDPIEFTEKVLTALPWMLQLRAKRTSARRALSVLREIKPRCARFDVSVYMNDRPDLAVLGGADGVHLGQDDLSVADVRRIAPGLLVGVSTHDIEQLERALALKPAYVAFGPVFETRTKENPDPVVGVAAVARARELAREAGVRLVVIGGINLENAAELSQLDVYAAVISALVTPTIDGVERRASHIDHLLRYGY